MNDIFTSSAIRAYNSCPRFYQYKYECLLDESGAPLFYPDSDALSLGRLVHECMAAWYMDLNSDDYREIIKNAKQSFNNKVVRQAEVLLDGRNYSEVLGIVPRLQEVVAIELELGAIIGDFKFAGKIDAIAKYDKRLWVIEHKTSRFEIKDETKYENALQTNIYLALTRANGYNVDGILVNYFRTLSLRQKVSESDEDFFARAYEDICARSETYYAFLQIPRTNDEVQSVLRDALRTIEHIRMDAISKEFGIENAEYYRRNWDACNEYHRACPFLDICTGKYKVEEIAKRNRLHVELDVDKIEFREEL